MSNLTKVEPGNFIITGFGPGLILNKYKGDPNNFLGETPEVVDVIYRNRITKGVEVSSIVKVVDKNNIGESKKVRIIKGIFKTINLGAYFG